MSQPIPTCFWDRITAQDSPLFLIGGTYLCQVHARCAGCQMPLLEILGHPVTCVCDEYSYQGHEELLLCSLECMEKAHLAYGPEEVQAEEEAP